MAINKARVIKESTIKRLYALSGNRCAFPDCKEHFVNQENETNLSNICHIEVLNSSNKREWDYFELFSVVNKNHSISLNLYLFWLGLEFNDLSEKYRLSEEKKVEEKIQKYLSKENSLSLVEQALSFTIGRIGELNQEKDRFNLDENYIHEVEFLNSIKFQLSKKAAEFSRLEMRKDLIYESKADLEREYVRIDTAQIKSLYEKAKSYIPNIQVSFEDTVKFHNDLVSEKLEYITGELPDLEERIKTLKSELFNLRKEEDSLIIKLKKSNTTEDLTKIVIELTNLSEKKGQLEEQKRMREESQTRLEKINADLKEINDGIASQDKLIQNRITEFNKYFSDCNARPIRKHTRQSVKYIG